MEIMNAQASGSSTEFKYVYGTKPANLFVSGTFDGATVVLQAQAPDGSWVDVRDGEIFEPVMLSMEAFPFRGRLNIVNPGPATNLHGDVVGQIYL